MSNEVWKNNAIQFPRLLAEIMAVGLDEAQWDGLLESMDLESDDLSKLFDRAQIEWEKIKAGPNWAEKLKEGVEETKEARRLIQPEVGDDEFICENCNTLGDIDDSFKPDGKKGVMLCEGCANAEKHEVKIHWGDVNTRREVPEPCLYSFGSLAELNAFLKGIDEADGWMDHEQIDPPDGKSSFEDKGDGA